MGGRGGGSFPTRRGNEITAAPLREGTYQPARSRPSRVLTWTERYAAPRLIALTSARGRCVAWSAIDTGTTRQYALTTTPARIAARRRTRCPRGLRERQTSAAATASSA